MTWPSRRSSRSATLETQREERVEAAEEAPELCQRGFLPGPLHGLERRRLRGQDDRQDPKLGQRRGNDAEVAQPRGDDGQVAQRRRYRAEDRPGDDRLGTAR